MRMRLLRLRRGLQFEFVFVRDGRQVGKSVVTPCRSQILASHQKQAVKSWLHLPSATEGYTCTPPTEASLSHVADLIETIAEKIYKNA